MSNENDHVNRVAGQMDDGEPITERQRLEASAMVAGAVSRDTSRQVVDKERYSSIIRDFVLGMLVIVVLVLGIRISTEGSRTKDAVVKGNQVNCQLFKDAGTTVPSAQTTIVGIKLLADFRNSYYRNDCQEKYGRLGPPGARLIPYLDKNAR